MNYICVGKLVNTHGIKGEVRIISNFKYKNQIFKKGFNLYIGTNKDKVVINTYRVHKQFDMLTFNDINDINEVLKYKGEDIYIDKDETKIDGILNEDLIGLDVYSNRYIGKVTDILDNKMYQLLVVTNDDHDNIIPYIDEFIENIDLANKKITIKEIEGLINEN